MLDIRMYIEAAIRDASLCRSKIWRVFFFTLPILSIIAPYPPITYHGCSPFIKTFWKFWLGIFVRSELHVSFAVCLKFPDCLAAIDWILVKT